MKTYDPNCLRVHTWRCASLSNLLRRDALCVEGQPQPEAGLHRPEHRGTAMAYDPVRQRVVLNGDAWIVSNYPDRQPGRTT